MPEKNSAFACIADRGTLKQHYSLETSDSRTIGYLVISLERDARCLRLNQVLRYREEGCPSSERSWAFDSEGSIFDLQMIQVLK